jgi:hypothetical protein
LFFSNEFNEQVEQVALVLFVGLGHAALDDLRVLGHLRNDDLNVTLDYDEAGK